VYSQKTNMLRDFGEVTPLPRVWGMPSTPPPQTGKHPRLMFDADKLDVIRLNTNSSENAPACEALKAFIGRGFDGILPVPGPDSPHSYNYNGNDLAAIESMAFDYALTGNIASGELAITAIFNYINTFVITDELSDNTRAYSHIILVIAEVYDWCHDLMDDEDRRMLVAAVCNILAPSMEMGFPPDRQGAVTGHGGEAQLLRDWLALAIAAYDEYPDIWYFVMGRIENEFVPARNFMYEAGSHNQGSAYGPYRFYFELWSALLIKRLNGCELYDFGNMRRVMPTFFSWLRPDGQSLRIGDDFNEKAKTYTKGALSSAAFYSAALFGDGVSKQYAYDVFDGFTKFNCSNNMTTPAQLLIFNDPLVPMRSMDLLPAYHITTYPRSGATLRTSWDTDAAMAYMKIGEAYSANHEHMDCGHFMLFYGKILASDSGLYDSYGSEEDLFYNKYSIAHNCPLIEEPEEPVSSKWRLPCGGQYTVEGTTNENRDLKLWFERGTADRCRTLGIAARADWAHAATDLTKAYHPIKARSVIRRMTAVCTRDNSRPMAFFVYDRIRTVKPEQTVVFPLHAQTEIKTAENVIRVDNGGSLICRTLLPKKPVYTLIGGEDANFMVCGRQMALRKQFNREQTVIEDGWGRVEVRSSEVSNDTEFMHAMYVTDSGEKSSAPASLITCETDASCGAVGALLGDVAAIFTRGAENAKRFTFILESAARVYISGVGAGYWTVTVNGNRHAARRVSRTEGMLEFAAPAGEIDVALAAVAEND